MKTIIGLFDEYQLANDAYQALRRLGYKKDEVSIVAKQDILMASRADEPADATTEGVAAGAAAGGLASVLIGISAIAIPGLGPVIAAGPLLAGLATAAVGAGIGAATGGFIGALIDLGVSDEQAEVYAAGIERGGLLLMVDTNDKNRREVVEIMRTAGAAEINTEEPVHAKAG